MKFLAAAVISLPFSAVLAAPALGSGPNRLAGPELVPVRGGNAVVTEAPVATPPAVADPVVADPAAGEPAEGGEGGEGGEGEGEGNEVELEAAFGDTVALEGGDLKQDVLYPPGVNGVFEVEFQNAEARTLTVTENLAPGTAPAGFQHIENSSYIVEVTGGTEGLTLQKIDYILNADNPLDISQGQIGRFCADAGVFVIDPALGELEFELEENELTLTVNSLNGEWAAFVPVAAGGGTETEAGAGEGDSTGSGPALLDALRAFISGSGA